MNTTKADTQVGIVASEVDSQMVVGPSGTTKLAPSGEISATTQNPIFQRKQKMGFQLMKMEVSWSLRYKFFTTMLAPY
jgi:hypothetical protein